MPLPGSTPDIRMTDRLRGTFGSFTTKGSRQMSYLGSRADMALLRLLKTPRQVLPRHIMPIRELVQRDIDDKRVREEIVKYLTPSLGELNAKFFPPLVVAILVRKSPNEGAGLIDKYPRPKFDSSGRFPREQDPTD